MTKPLHLNTSSSLNEKFPSVSSERTSLISKMIKNNE